MTSGFYQRIIFGLKNVSYFTDIHNERKNQTVGDEKLLIAYLSAKINPFNANSQQLIHIGSAYLRVECEVCYFRCEN